METLRGEVVGKHEGLMYYTIGQRKGLGLGGDKGPWFVLGKDIKRNVLLVGYQEDQDYLYSNRCFASSFNWLKEDFEEIEVLAQFRYRSKAVKAKVRRIDKDTVEVKYEPFRAVTPGQAVVFYNNDEMLGGAVIDEVYQDDQRRLY
jgi:tRNA-specific 2-thiouridylase